MGVNLDISQAVAYSARVRTGAGRLGAAGSAALRRAAYAIQADAQALAPVDTGALRSSISTTVTGDGRFGAMAAEIGPTVEYGIYQEFGTSTQAGQPYLTPAFDRQVPGFQAAIARLADGML